MRILLRQQLSLYYFTVMETETRDGLEFAEDHTAMTGLDYESQHSDSRVFVSEPNRIDSHRKLSISGHGGT